MMRNKLLYRFGSLLNCLTLIFQLFYPGLITLATQAEAAGVPTASIGFTSGTNTFNIAISTDKEVKYFLGYSRENGPTEAVNGTETMSSQFEKDVYAGTCSAGVCTPHQVKKGILKWSAGAMQGAILFTVDAGVLSTVSSYGIEKLELTSEEDVWLNGTDISPPSSSLPAPTIETPKECLADGTAVTTASNDVWSSDNATGIAETKEVVKLGVKYVFPQNGNVSVTFNCLPKNVALRTALKIQQVKTSDLKLPSDLTSLGEYAYDITTGMEDGTFTYDVTLPKSPDGNAQISYIEKSVDSAKNYQIADVEVMRIDDGKTVQQGASVKATDINHFTIFIATYDGGGLFALSKTSYIQGEIVYAKTYLPLIAWSSVFYRIDILNPSGVSVAHSGCANWITSLDYSYLTSSSDPAGANWKAEITRYGNSTNCTNRTNRVDVGSSVFELKAAVAPTLKLVKVVDKGPRTPANFTLTATGTSLGFSDLGSSTTFHTVTANVPYALSESTVAGYSQSGSWSCTGGSLNRSVVTLGFNQNVTCTITNTRDTGWIKVNKEVDLNGDGDWSDWTESSNTNANLLGFRWILDGTEKTFGSTAKDVVTTLPDDNHSFGETISSDYHFVSWYKTNETGRSCTNPNGTTLPTTIDVAKDTTTEITLCNARNAGTLVTHKFEDNNANQAQDSDESDLSGWNINLYEGSNCHLLDWQRTITTNASGNADFGTLPTGNYSISETLKSGWHNTTQASSDQCQNVTISNNVGTTVDFGNYKLGSITIEKTTSPASAETFTYRGSLGTHDFYNLYSHTYDDLEIGTYTITEDEKSGWYLDDLVCNHGSVSVSDRKATISVTAGLDTTCTFLNYKKGIIHGEKYNDLNGDGEWSLFDLEPFMNGWTIFIDTNKDGVRDSDERWDITHGWAGFVLGDYFFDDLMPGDYNVCEEMQPGWAPTSGSNCKTTTIHDRGGDIDILLFGNRQAGSISVQKFEDLNGDGVKNAPEIGGRIDGWQMSVYAGYGCTNQTISNGSKNTDANGIALFENILPGQYSVKETTDPGWQNTTGSCINVDVGAGNVSHVNVGNQRNFVNVTVNKSDDIDPAVPGEVVTYSIPWTIESNGGATLRLVENVMNETGTPVNYSTLGSFNPGWYSCYTTRFCKNLGVFEAGSFSGTETFKVQVMTDAIKGDQIHNYTILDGTYYNWAGPNQSIPGASDDETTTITTSSVTVYKYNDLNEDGIHDKGEVYMPDWTIYLDQTEAASLSAETGEDGSAVFSNISEGPYVLSEEIQTGWSQTNIHCFQEMKDENGRERETENYYSFMLNRGEDLVCEIGNHYVPPELTIKKYNDRWPSAQAPGSEVHYTIVLTALNNPVNNPFVRDLLPKNIKYRAGSYKVMSSSRGDLTASISAPSYASPGTWSLDDMLPDEEITLTYTGDVDGDIKPGTYKDVAWAAGTWTSGYEESDHTVIADAEVSGFADDGVVADTFVGTKVIVDRSTSDNRSVSVIKEEQRGGLVLGATTELPGTGEPAVLVLLIVGLLTVGGGLHVASRKMRRQHD